MTVQESETLPTAPRTRSIAREVAPSTWWHVPALLLVAILLLTPWRGAWLLHGDAALYATIAKAVAQTGELTHLTFNGRPYVNKPPLFFWLTAGVYQMIGINPVAPLLVSGLLGVANVLLLYAICRRMGFDAGSSFAASLAYLTTPEVIHWTRGVHLESLLTFWHLLGILAAYLSLTRPGAILFLGLAAAGGWMSKGPQALFAVAVAPLLWWQHGLLRARLTSRWTVVGAVLFALLVGPWTRARILEGSGYAQAYFRGQIGGVLIDTPKNQRSPLWYLGMLIKTYWPWLPFAVAGLVLLARRWRRDPAAQVWLDFGAIVLVVSMAASARRMRYLFPLYPVLAVAAGSSLGALARRRGRLLPALAAIALVISVVVAIADSDHSSDASDLLRAEAIEVAQALPAGAETWLASDVPQEGMPGMAKVLGAYAPPLLCACGARCPAPGEAAEGIRVVTLAASADELARKTDAVVERRNRSLAILRLPPGSGAAAREHVCALEPVMLPW